MRLEQSHITEAHPIAPTEFRIPSTRNPADAANVRSSVLPRRARSGPRQGPPQVEHLPRVADTPAQRGRRPSAAWFPRRGRDDRCHQVSSPASQERNTEADELVAGVHACATGLASGKHDRLPNPWQLFQVVGDQRSVGQGDLGEQRVLRRQPAMRGQVCDTGGGQRYQHRAACLGAARSVSRLPARRAGRPLPVLVSPETHCPDGGFDLNRAEQANMHDQPPHHRAPTQSLLGPDGCTAGGLDTPTHRCYFADGDGRNVASSPGSAGPRPPTDSILHAGPARARSCRLDRTAMQPRGGYVRDTVRTALDRI